MNLARNILRGILLLLIVFSFIYLNVETTESIRNINDFEFEFHKKIKTDSLDLKYKFDLLSNGATSVTAQIFENTSHIRETLNYLAGIIALLIAVELSLKSLKKEENKIKKDTEQRLLARLS